MVVFAGLIWQSPPAMLGIQAFFVLSRAKRVENLVVLTIAVVSEKK
jgi:hypothetical protein